MRSPAKLHAVFGHLGSGTVVSYILPNSIFLALPEECQRENGDFTFFLAG